MGELAKLDYTAGMNSLGLIGSLGWWIGGGCTTLQEMVDIVEPPTNVVFIMVDTLRPDRLGIYGHHNATSPNLDRYAQTGMVFERAYAHSGWTLPSTVSMMTGLYPHEHRVGRAPDSPSEFGSLPEERTTLAEVFQQQGYATMAVVNNTFLAPDFGLAQGFATFDYRGADNQDIRSARESTDVALKWWQGTEGPKFMFWHVMEPHMDLLPPEEARGTFVSTPTVDVPFDFKQGAAITKQAAADRDPQQIADVLALYDEEILAVDQQLGRLVERIGTDNTIFVFTSDHGEEFWEHDDFEHGHHLKSVLTHIPLIFWGKGITSGRERILVSHVDMFHSILSLLKLPIPIESHGDMLFGEVLPSGRMVLSENTLYGDPLLSVVSETHRLEINQESKMAALWTMDESGREAEVLRDNLDELATPLFNYIRAIRGDVNTIEQVNGPSVPSQEAFQNLKKLGYIDEER